MAPPPYISRLFPLAWWWVAVHNYIMIVFFHFLYEVFHGNELKFSITWCSNNEDYNKDKQSQHFLCLDLCMFN